MIPRPMEGSGHGCAVRLPLIDSLITTGRWATADLNQVFCGHLICMNTWGYIASYGIFQAYYTSALDRSPADIAWIGSIQLFLTFFIGAFIGRYSDAGFLRMILLCGTFLIALGAFAASFATQYWQLLLSQGLCCGLGNGCLVTPAVSVISTYFERRRSLAIGIINCGGATGGVIFPAMARQLIPSVGFSWTMRAIGFVQLVSLLCACLGLRSRLPPRKISNRLGLTKFQGLDFTIFTIGTFFVSEPGDASLLCPTAATIPTDRTTDKVYRSTWPFSTDSTTYLSIVVRLSTLACHTKTPSTLFSSSMAPA